MNDTLQKTVKMLRETYGGAQIKTSRNFLDLFADRIRQAATEPTLLGFAERLQALVDAAASRMEGDTITAFIGSCAAPDAPAVLAWVRQYHRIAAMLAALKDEASMTEALATIEINQAGQQDPGHALPRNAFDIGMEVRCLTPLAHGGDAKAGNATIFRRMQILSTTGAVLSLPFYAGNAFRGMLRDALADHLLSALGLTPRRDKPPVALWFFHALYAGGALEEDSAAQKAFSSRFGKAAGSLKTDALREFRDLLPATSLLGTALGNRILCGRVQFGDLRPRCREWGNGEPDAGALMEWVYLTRREDHEQHEEHSGMIATCECLKPGVRLEGGVDRDGHISVLELAALARGLLLIRDRGRLGAESRRDLGGVRIEYANLPDPRPYDDFLAQKKEYVLKYLTYLGAVHESF
jgi:hypothetical protein